MVLQTVIDIKREGDLFTFNSSTYENDVCGRLEESIHEYIDDPQLMDKLSADIKKILLRDLEERKETYDRVASVVKSIFPDEELDFKTPVVLG